MPLKVMTQQPVRSESRRKKPTSVDVANLAGVSQITVSRVFSGSAPVAESTVKQVLKAAQTLGYRPNGSARAMKSGRFDCIGLLAGTHLKRSSLPHPMLSGIQNVCTANGLKLVLGEMDDSKLSDEDTWPQLIREWSVDGLLMLYTFDMPPRMIEHIDRWKLPVVWLNSDQPDNAVLPDDRGAAREATRRLIKLGHRRIAFIRQPGQRHVSLAARESGYRDEMASAGLDPIIPDVSDWEGEEQDLVARSMRILERDDRPSAVVGYGPLQTVPFYCAASRMGICVPDDLSLITFHDEWHLLQGVPVSFMEIPVRQVGETAVRVLLERIRLSAGPLPVRQVPFSFWDQGSLAPPR